jgi:hypothetical protein
MSLALSMAFVEACRMLFKAGLWPPSIEVILINERLSDRECKRRKKKGWNAQGYYGLNNERLSDRECARGARRRDVMPTGITGWVFCIFLFSHFSQRFAFSFQSLQYFPPSRPNGHVRVAAACTDYSSK